MPAMATGDPEKPPGALLPRHLDGDPVLAKRSNGWPDLAQSGSDYRGLQRAASLHQWQQMCSWRATEPRMLLLNVIVPA